jgi:pilus assembly protein Flp/PilA
MLKIIVMADIAKQRVAALLADRRGVTAMEYGIIAATTVVVVGTAIGAIAGPLGTIWTDISTALTTAAA